MKRAAFALSALSIACMVALSATHAPMADRWLSALPFALLGWLGFAAAAASAALGARDHPRVRALAGVLALVWVALWVLTFSEGAQDALASVRRAVFAFIAL